jgi:hypothetical protein
MKALFWGTIGLACISILAPQATSQSSASKSEFSRAMSAAPPSVAMRAAIASMDEKGRIEELRYGTNGWTCLAHDPGAPIGYPVCVDQAGLEWFQAEMAGHMPDPDHTGYSYMLKGGSTWSNTDPSATRLPLGQKDFIRVPPHIMILNAKAAISSGFPSGQANPDTRKPFVMYGGTPYAILIIPVS